jgi:hypothetical protein
MEDIKETTPLKIALFESVRKRVLADGFELNAEGDNFVRRHDGITDIFQLTCLDAKPGYRVQPGMAVRVDQIEDIFHQTSGFEFKYQKGTPTMGTRVGSLLGGSPRACEFLLESEAEITAVTEKLMSAFREFVLPYFDHWGSLTAIDAELNDKPAERTPHRALAWFRCSTGIIVAKLVGRPDYERLAAFYTDVMTRDNKGFYFKRFEALAKYLESVAAGGGLAK